MAMVKQEIAHRGWPRYRKQQYSNQSIARTVCPGKGSSGSQGVRTSKEDRT
jgi:hypothetical protein